MEEAERLCDRIAIMDEGRIVAAGTLADLLQIVGMGEVIEIKGPPRGLESARLHAIPDVTKVETAGNMTRIFVASAGRALAAVATAVAAEGVAVEGIEIYPVNLERVFMHLTGKALRD